MNIIQFTRNDIKWFMAEKCIWSKMKGISSGSILFLLPMLYYSVKQYKLKKWFKFIYYKYNMILFTYKVNVKCIEMLYYTLFIFNIH